MGLNILLLFFTFSALTILGLLQADARQRSLSRSSGEWLYDGLGLFIQGVLIPLTPLFLLPLIVALFPSYAGNLDVPPGLQFLLSFVVVDYLYYWNHRWFHTKSFWPLHRLHNSSRMLDVLATSRNSLITSFLFVYFWVQSLALFLFRDASVFMTGLALTYALDLYRHSGLGTHRLLREVLGLVLILPEHHVVHHSQAGRARNFGANFSLWDRLHGTYSAEVMENRNLEKLPEGSFSRNILFPWSKA